MKFIILGGSQKGSSEFFAEEWSHYNKAIILEIDIDNGEVSKKIEYVSPDKVRASSNSGILFKSGAYKNNNLFCCTPTEILVYKLPNYKLINYLSKRTFNDLHHVTPHSKEGMLVASTGLDLVQHISDDGQILSEWNVLNPNKQDSTWEKFSRNIDYRKVPTTKPHLVHPNFICEYDDDFYVTRFEQRDVIALKSGKTFNIDIERPHDGLIENNIGVYTTVNGHVVFLDIIQNKIICNLDINKLYPDNSVLGWCRSICKVDDEHYLVGFSSLRPTKFVNNLKWLKNKLLTNNRKKSLPTRIILINIKKNQIINEFNLNDYDCNVIFSIIKK